MKKCPKCQKNKDTEEFYKKSKTGKTQSYCKSCHKTITIERLKSYRKEFVDYGGGKCQKCGYNKCVAALEFHHEGEKDPSWSKFKNRKLNEEIKRELNRCVLLCANCHREAHHYAE